MIGTDVYACWRACLRGEAVTPDMLLPTGLGGVDGHPQPGIYKMRDGGGWENGVKQDHRYIPVKVYLTDTAGQIVHKWADGLSLGCVAGNGEARDPIKIWSWCKTRDKTGASSFAAISQDDYKYWLAHQRWPSDLPVATATVAAQPEASGAATEPAAPSAGIGHNSGEDPDSIEALMRAVQQQHNAVEEWLKVEREGQSAGDTAGNWLDELRKLETRVKAAFEAEKAPHLEAGRAVDEKWRPIKTMAEAVKKRMAGALTAIGAKEKARLQKIADEAAAKRAAEIRAQQEAEYQRKLEEAKALREAQAEEARKRREADEAAMASGELPLAPPPPVEPEVVLPPPPPPVAPVVVAETVKVSFGGSTGRKVAISTRRAAVITDWKAAASHYAMSPRVQEVVQKLADADAKNGIACPGATITTADAAA